MSGLESFLNRELFGIGNYEFSVARIFGALLVLGIGILAKQLLSVSLRRYSERKNPQNRGKIVILDQLQAYVIYAFTILFVLQALGVNLSVLIASSAALLVGFGLGIQNVVNNFVSGISLMFGKGVSINDVIEVDGKMGRVRQVGFRVTELITPLDESILIPNSLLIQTTVRNMTLERTHAAFEIEIPVGYNTNIKTAQKILLDTALNNKNVLSKPQPQVLLRDFGSSGLILHLRIWVKDSFGIITTKSDLRYQILERFREKSIEIPYPQRVVHLQHRP